MHRTTQPPENSMGYAIASYIGFALVLAILVASCPIFAG